MPRKTMIIIRRLASLPVWLLFYASAGVSLLSGLIAETITGED